MHRWKRTCNYNAKCLAGEHFRRHRAGSRGERPGCPPPCLRSLEGTAGICQLVEKVVLAVSIFIILFLELIVGNLKSFGTVFFNEHCSSNIK